VGLVWVPEVLSDYYVHADNRYFSHWLNLRRYDDGYFLRNARFLDDPAHHAADVDLVMSLRPRNVLDVGCGRGWTVQALRERGVGAWGADPARGLPGLTVVPDWFTGATADRLPFADRSFDVVLCSDMLAHIPEAFVARSLSDIVRVCGGYFVATVDCVDPTREGHLTIRPRAWWNERFREAGLQSIAVDGSATVKRPDGLEVFVCRVERTAAGQGNASLPTFEHRAMAAEQLSRV
jgi:SAM-dependent methyltransferase